MMFLFRRVFPAVFALVLIGCGQGGRDVSGSERGAAQPQQDDANVLLDPVGQLLEPTGLGYRVETIWGEGDDAIRQTAYGVDGLPVGVDIDGDSSTGTFLGADISVHFFALLLYARMQVDVLESHVGDKKLQVEVILLDPRNLLGLPGLFGVVDADWRISLGVTGSDQGFPEQHTAELQVFDTLFEFLPRITTAELSTTSSEAVPKLSSSLSAFTERDGSRFDGLMLSGEFQPAVSSSSINVELAPDAENSSITLQVAEPSAMQLSVKSYDGDINAVEAERNISLALRNLAGELSLDLQGVDGLDALEGRDTVYALTTSSAIEELELRLLDLNADGERREAQAFMRPLPERIDIVKTAEGHLSIETSSPIEDLSFAQVRNAPLQWPPDNAPGQPFTQHGLRLNQAREGREILQARFGGIEKIHAKMSGDLEIEASLATAPLNYLFEEPDGFTRAQLALLPAQLRIEFPEDDEQLRFNYQASAASPSLKYESQNQELSMLASVEPLPAELSLCAAADASCGSHGESTDASISLQASESMLINAQQRSADGRREFSISDLFVRELHVDAGGQSGFRRGYVYFDTQGHSFGGDIFQQNGNSGLYLSFAEGTFAEQRKVRFKNFVQIDQRSGTMRCPGKEELEVRSGGEWYDGGFLLDQLCQ